MAEAQRDEIAKLEALYAANPEGRVFAHLAEAYRKAGELDHAREILQNGLGRHPDFASAYVVLGKVEHDRADHDAAREAFGQVLERDGGNLIALQFLAELALERGDRPEALRHYSELLNRDLTNAGLRETVDQLRREVAAVPEPAGDEVESAAAEIPGLETADVASAEEPSGAWFSPEAVAEAAIPAPALDAEPGDREAGEPPAEADELLATEQLWAGGPGEPEYPELELAVEAGTAGEAAEPGPDHPHLELEAIEPGYRAAAPEPGEEPFAESAEPLDAWSLSVAEPEPEDAPAPAIADEPEESIREPEESIREPEESFREPDESFREPEESFREPVESIQEPVESIQEPVEELFDWLREPDLPREEAAEVEAEHEPVLDTAEPEYLTLDTEVVESTQPESVEWPGEGGVTEYQVLGGEAEPARDDETPPLAWEEAERAASGWGERAAGEPASESIEDWQPETADEGFDVPTEWRPAGEEATTDAAADWSALPEQLEPALEAGAEAGADGAGTEASEEPAVADQAPTSEPVAESIALETDDFVLATAFEAPAETVPNLDDLTSIGDFQPPADEPIAASQPPAPEAAGLAETGLLTETMAELYRRQGFGDRAADVYRSLLARDPENQRLQGLLNEVAAEHALAVAGMAERSASGAREWLDSVQEVESAFIGGAGATESGDSPYSWGGSEESVLAGPPIGEYFRTLLSWRPAAGAVEKQVGPAVEQAAAVVGEAPGTEPAELLLVEEVSGEAPMIAAAASETLADLQPEESFPGWSPADLEAPAVGPPVPPAADLMPWEFAEPPVLSTEPVSGGLEAVSPGSAGASSSGRPAAERQGGGELEAEDEDLEIFRSWLQSLKK